MIRPQIWPRRQEMPQQRVEIGLTPIEEVERTNTVISQLQQQRAEFALHNPQAMNIDRRENLNCYSCRGFGYLARNCRNRGIENNKRIEYEVNKSDNNLNGDGGLMGPN